MQKLNKKTAEEISSLINTIIVAKIFVQDADMMTDEGRKSFNVWWADGYKAAQALRDAGVDICQFKIQFPLI